MVLAPCAGGDTSGSLQDPSRASSWLWVSGAVFLATVASWPKDQWPPTPELRPGFVGLCKGQGHRTVNATWPFHPRGRPLSCLDPGDHLSSSLFSSRISTSSGKTRLVGLLWAQRPQLQSTCFSANPSFSGALPSRCVSWGRSSVRDSAFPSGGGR